MKEFVISGCVNRGNAASLTILPVADTTILDEEQAERDAIELHHLLVSYVPARTFFKMLRMLEKDGWVTYPS